jgi:hypothetical protein
MQIKNDATWTRWEVSAVLRDSEGRALNEEPGHAEGNHELRAVGTRRQNITELELEERLWGSEREGMDFEEWLEYRAPRKASAFDGSQVDAVTFAFNTKAGQTALAFLRRDTVSWLFAAIDISAGAFPMVEVDTSRLDPLPAGVGFVASQWGIAMPGYPTYIRCIAQGIRMKLMKTPRKDLHIQTAYPASTFSGAQQKMRVAYTAPGVQRQEFPI